MQQMGSRYDGTRPDERPAFPFDLEAFREHLAVGDEQVCDVSTLGISWLRETNLGYFRSWTDLAFLHQNWDGPIVVLKGIQSVQDTHVAMDAHVNGIIVSNHGTSLACGEAKVSNTDADTPDASYVVAYGCEQCYPRCRSMASRVALSLAVPLNVIE